MAVLKRILGYEISFWDIEVNTLRGSPFLLISKSGFIEIVSFENGNITHEMGDKITRESVRDAVFEWIGQNELYLLREYVHACNNSTDINNNLSLERFKRQVIETNYENEIKKEADLISQSLQMQYAFSFMAATIFIVAQIACRYSSNVSLNAIYIIFSIISAPLLVCMTFATMAQMRMKHNESGDADEIVKYIDDNCEHLKCEVYQCKYITTLYQKLQMSISRNNEKRIKYLRISQISLFITIGICCIGYIVYSIMEFI